MQSRTFCFASFFASFLLPIFFAHALSANIVQIVFTTDLQSIAVGAISGKITVQTQNGPGASEQLDETSDLTLSSSSGTGEFSSSATAWNPDATLTMSNGSSNRNFYYKDTANVNAIITATVVGRVSGKRWTATQNITVGTPSSNTPPDNTASSTPSGGGNDAATSTPTLNSFISAHGGGNTLSVFEGPIEFEVSGGRHRLSVSGAPVIFESKVVALKNLSRPNKYLWSFGDGLTSEGNKVIHTYEFPGTYNVVLNAYSGEEIATWRGIVKVIKPDVLITEANEKFVELSNKSAFEINIQGWTLEDGFESFIFPPDTIISPGAKIAFSRNMMKLTRFPIELRVPSREKVAEWKQTAPIVVHLEAEPQGKVQSVSASATTSSPAVESFEEKLAIVKEKVSALTSAVTVFSSAKKTAAAATAAAALPLPEPKKSGIVNKVPEEGKIANNETLKFQNASVGSVESKKGFFEKILSLPRRSLQAIKNRFF